MLTIAERNTVTYVRNLKSNTPCIRCRKKFHYSAMQFDHKPGVEKVGNINRLMWRVSLEKLKKEIDKTIITCSNCHSIITYERTTGKKVNNV